MRRRLAILIVALLAAPGTWVRSPPPEAWDRTTEDGWDLIVQPLDLAQRVAGETRIAGGWVLYSDYRLFGGYSALVRLADGRLLAASDLGRLFAFAPPGEGPGRQRAEFFAGLWNPNKHLVDMEGMTRDPASGRIWIAYEGSNSIERLEADLSRAGQVRPAAMREWPGNSGPETLLRLSDGRFLVLSESRSRWLGNEHPALLFPFDPVDGAEPVRFTFTSTDGFRPVDAAELPDGRVAILMRRFDWVFPGFKTRVLIADPGAIRAGKSWTGRQIAAIEAPGPTENYEGMAVEPLANGAVRLWLISDDNRSVIQRTQLLTLDWQPQ